MRNHEIEAWALSIIDRIKNGQPIEDFRVEIKSKFLDPVKAARRIAGHANAAQGTPIIWIVGVDEKTAEIITQTGCVDRADWFEAVRSQFDGLAPEFIDLNVPFNGYWFRQLQLAHFGTLIWPTLTS